MTQENLKKAICYMKDHPEVRSKMSKNAKIHSKIYDEDNYYNISGDPL